MVWIYNYEKKELQSEPNLVKARAKAVRQLEGVKNGHVPFFKTKKSRNSYASVEKETYSNGDVSFMWGEWSSKTGTVYVPMYKNGKIRRG